MIIEHKFGLPILVMLSVSQESRWLEEYFFILPGEIGLPGDVVDKPGDFGLLIRVLDNDNDWKERIKLLFHNDCLFSLRKVFHLSFNIIFSCGFF